MQRRRETSMTPAHQPSYCSHCRFTQVWEDVSLDFINGLPKSFGKNSIMVVVDRRLGNMLTFSLWHTHTQSRNSLLYVSKVSKLHGMPQSITSNWENFYKPILAKIFQDTRHPTQHEHGLSPPVIRTDRHSESLFQNVSQVHDQPEAKAVGKLPSLGRILVNIMFHQSADMSPFKALYGRELPWLIRYSQSSTTVHEVDRELCSQDQLLKQLKDNLDQAQHRMKQQVDLHKNEVKNSVGDQVYLKLQPYRHISIFRRTRWKLTSRFYGPF